MFCLQIPCLPFSSSLLTEKDDFQPHKLDPELYFPRNSTVFEFSILFGVVRKQQFHWHEFSQSDRKLAVAPYW